MGYQTTNSKIIGDDDHFSDCILSTHPYPFYSMKLVSEQKWRGLLDYMGPVNNNSSIAFLKGTVHPMREYAMGSCYWPGLRQSDTDSSQVLNRTVNNASSLFLTNTIKAGVAQLKQ
jgi:hypothetical protein